jgi:caffeoyl-CoA O-methyltransferase
VRSRSARSRATPPSPSPAGCPRTGTLLCCDVSEEWTAIGRRYWAEAGVDGKIDLRIAPATETLRALPADTRFDLAFIDADKSSYGTYYEEILARMDSGGLILVDNTIWSGRVLDDAPADRDTAALIAFNAALAADDRVDVVRPDLPRRRDDGAQALTAITRAQQRSAEDGDED